MSCPSNSQAGPGGGSSGSPNNPPSSLLGSYNSGGYNLDPEGMLEDIDAAETLIHLQSINSGGNSSGSIDHAPSLSINHPPPPPSAIAIRGGTTLYSPGRRQNPSVDGSGTGENRDDDANIFVRPKEVIRFSNPYAAPPPPQTATSHPNYGRGSLGKPSSKRGNHQRAHQRPIMGPPPPPGPVNYSPLIVERGEPDKNQRQVHLEMKPPWSVPSKRGRGKRGGVSSSTVMGGSGGSTGSGGRGRGRGRGRGSKAVSANDSSTINSGSSVNNSTGGSDDGSPSIGDGDGKDGGASGTSDNPPANTIQIGSKVYDENFFDEILNLRKLELLQDPDILALLKNSQKQKKLK